LVLKSPVLYRLGSISIEEIEAVIGVLKIQIHKGEAPAPGMLSKHYAPQTKTILSEAITQDLILFDKKESVNQTFFENENIVAHEVLSPTGNLTEAASQLYNALHRSITP
jgi:L-threonylcarbamoyladenylate synthase